MKFGFLAVNSAAGISPGRLASEVEARGYESVWLPEHSHIPTSRRTPYPAGGELPDGYLHMMNPFVSLAAAIGTTTNLTLATGICLALEHDLLDLATTATTLDVLSGGRFVMGIGAGWNAEELANHQPGLPFGRRYRALEERIAALRVLWSDDPVSFDGEFDRVDESWVYPKPANGAIPIALGMAGDRGRPMAARLADEWCPIDVEMHAPDGRMSVGAAIEQFRNDVDAAGRDQASVPITIFAMKPPRADIVEKYAALGVDRVVFGPHEMTLHGADATLRHLDALQPLIDANAESKP
jgi:probable F420-dependent oxidoreductase